MFGLLLLFAASDPPPFELRQPEPRLAKVARVTAASGAAPDPLQARVLRR